MTTQPMTEVGRATMGGKSMKATAPAVKAAKSTTTRVKPTASTAVKSTASTTVKSTTSTSAATAPGKCRDVRHDAKRAHRKTCRQNAYCSLHGVLPNSGRKLAQHSRADLPISNCCLRREFQM